MVRQYGAEGLDRCQVPIRRPGRSLVPRTEWLPVQMAMMMTMNRRSARGSFGRRGPIGPSGQLSEDKDGDDGQGRDDGNQRQGSPRGRPSRLVRISPRSPRHESPPLLDKRIKWRPVAGLCILSKPNRVHPILDLRGREPASGSSAEHPPDDRRSLEAKARPSGLGVTPRGPFWPPHAQAGLSRLILCS